MVAKIPRPGDPVTAPDGTTSTWADLAEAFASEIRLMVADELAPVVERVALMEARMPETSLAVVLDAIRTLARNDARMFAREVSVRLNALEAGKPVAALDYKRLRDPVVLEADDPEQAQFNELVAPFVSQVRSAVADELDALAPRVRALLEARKRNEDA